jgi:hypothetical protein
LNLLGAGGCEDVDDGNDCRVGASPITFPARGVLSSASGDDAREGSLSTSISTKVSLLGS